MSNSSSRIMFPTPLITPASLHEWITRRSRFPKKKPPLKGWLMLRDSFVYVTFRGPWGFFNLNEVGSVTQEGTPFKVIFEDPEAQNLIVCFTDGSRVRLTRHNGSSIEISSPGFQQANPDCTRCGGVGSYNDEGVPKACECLHDDE